MKFSTGHRELDQYLGGIQKGDALLWITNRLRDFRPLAKYLVEYCGQTRIPLVVLTHFDSPFSQFFSFHSNYIYKLFDMGAKEFSLIRKITKSLSSRSANSYIIIDDLSSLKKNLGNETRLVQLFDRLVKLAVSKKALVVTYLRRSDFQEKTLAALKDKATIAAELVEREGKLYCVPVSTVNRYVPHRFLPFHIQERYHSRVVRPRPAPPTRLARPVSDSSERAEGSLASLRLRSGPRRKRERGERTRRESEGILKAIEGELFSSAEKYRAVFENAGEPMMVFHGTGGYREVNKNLAEMLGYSIEDLRTISPLAIVSKEDSWKVLRMIGGLRQRQHHVAQISIVKKTGKKLFVEVRISSLGNGWYFCVLSDLSTRHVEHDLRRSVEDRARQLENYKNIVERSHVATAVFVGNMLAYANGAFLRMFHYESVKELIRKKIFEFFRDENSAELTGAVRAARKSTAELPDQLHQSVELRAVTRRGETFACECRISKTGYGGKEALQLAVTNIHAQKELIRDLTVTARQYRSVVDKSLEAALLIRNGLIIYANSAFLKLLGYENVDEILNKDFAINVDASKRKAVSRLVKDRVFGTSQETHQWRLLRKDGSTFEARVVAAPLDGEGDHVTAFFVRDVSEEKKLAERLREQIKEDELIEGMISILNESLGSDQVLDKSLSRIMQDLSFSAGGLYAADQSEKAFQLVHHVHLPEKLRAALSLIPRDEGLAGLVVKTQESYQFSIQDYPSYLPYKSLLGEAGVHMIAIVPLCSRERVAGILLLTSNERSARQRGTPRLYSVIGKHLGTFLESTMREREKDRALEQRRLLIESVPDALYSRSRDGNFLFLGPQVEQITGYAQKDFSRNPSLWLSIIHPDDRSNILSQMARLDDLEDAFVHEYRILPKGKADYRWVRDSVSLIRDQSHSVLTINGVLSDITEVKARDKEFREQTSTA